MAVFPVPRCLAETAPREDGVRGWIVTVPGIVGTLCAAMVGDTVNDAFLLARADVGLPSAPTRSFEAGRGRARVVAG